nr:gametocyte-specific factor 1 [Agelaius phoeniceus]
MEPDALVQCPYDRSHQVRVSRLPYHLVRCQQNNPQVSRTLATCPFNARHRVPRALLRAHVTSCPDKLPLELPPEPEDMTKTAHTWQPPPCQEDWDAELSEQELEEPPPFILQVTKGDLPVPCHRTPEVTPPDPAAPPEGLTLRKPRPATAGPRCPSGVLQVSPSLLSPWPRAVPVSLVCPAVPGLSPSLLSPLPPGSPGPPPVPVPVPVPGGAQAPPR